MYFCWKKMFVFKKQYVGWKIFAKSKRLWQIKLDWSDQRSKGHNEQLNRFGQFYDS